MEFKSKEKGGELLLGTILGSVEKVLSNGKIFVTVGNGLNTKKPVAVIVRAGESIPSSATKVFCKGAIYLESGKYICDPQEIDFVTKDEKREEGDTSNASEREKGKRKPYNYELLLQKLERKIRKLFGKKLKNIRTEKIKRGVFNMEIEGIPNRVEMITTISSEKRWDESDKSSYHFHHLFIPLNKIKYFLDASNGIEISENVYFRRPEDFFEWNKNGEFYPKNDGVLRIFVNFDRDLSEFAFATEDEIFNALNSSLIDNKVYDEISSILKQRLRLFKNSALEYLLVGNFLYIPSNRSLMKAEKDKARNSEATYLVLKSYNDEGSVANISHLPSIIYTAHRAQRLSYAIL